MFYQRLTDEFSTRPKDQSRRFLRGLMPSASVKGLLDNPRFGAFAALGAVVVGAGLMVANIERGDSDAPAAVALAQTPAPAPQPVAPSPRAAQAPEQAASAVPVAPASPVALAPPSPEKTTARVDTTSTGAIAQDMPAKPKHKAHPKKQRVVDNAN